MRVLRKSEGEPKIMKNEFSPDDIQAFTPSEKVGLLACINPDGLPHIALITSMQASGPKELIAGEFVTGVSKKYIQQNHNISFLIMSFDRNLWRGRAIWTHLEKSGLEYELMNQIPMFRYNTYFGINTVHYFDLLEVSEKAPLPMNGIIFAAVKSMLAKGGLKTGKKQRILKPFLEKMFNQLDGLKFISYVGADGFPTITPIIQCQAADSTRLVFSTGVFSDELEKIPTGAQVAVYCMNLGIESVLTRGVFNGFKRVRGIRLGSVDINWAYNSMPPANSQIYPEIPLKAVTEY
jgi:hypothetical protein